MKYSSYWATSSAYQTGVAFNTKKKTLLLSWHHLLESLCMTLAAYYEARKMMFLGHFQGVVNQVRTVTRDLSFRKLLLAIIPFLTYLLIFSSYTTVRHLTHLDKVTHPDYITLSTLEYRLFFCHPHRLLSALANPIFDILAAVPYLIHFPLPFLFSAYLASSARKRQALYPFIWCAGWVNLITVLFQTTFPTAPPWFTDSAVIDEHGNVVYEFPNEAGFKRLDRLFSFTLFHNIYANSPLKFGAFPSLHIAWPMVILLNHPWFNRKVAVGHIVWITLAALYTTHHWLLDALGGIILVVIVRMCMYRIWSPFSELDEASSGEEEDGTRLTKSYVPVSNGTVDSNV